MPGNVSHLFDHQPAAWVVQRKITQDPKLARVVFHGPDRKGVAGGIPAGWVQNSTVDAGRLHLRQQLIRTE
jgi:hypothetical protein